MSRVLLKIKQGAVARFTLRWPAADLTLYDIYIQFRPTWGSSVAFAAKEPIFELKLEAGTSTPAGAITYGDAVDGIQDSIAVVIGADLTALLPNQDPANGKKTHKADVLLVLISDPAKERVRLAEFDVLVDPRVTVVE